MKTYPRAAQLKFLLALLAATSLLWVGGCKGDSSGSSSAEESASSESAGESEKSGDEAPEEVGPRGPSSIDNGGITEIPSDPELAEKGKQLFSDNGCQACHKADQKLVGPALAGVTERREPEWLARMILHPEKMLEKDPIAKSLLAEHMTPMPNQNITPDEAKAIIAYLATMEKK